VCSKDLVQLAAVMGGSKPLSEWISHMEKCGISLCKKNGIVIITVIGKDTSSTSKVSDLNEALGGSYLTSCDQRSFSGGSIDAFFSFDLEALFLIVNSHKDVAAFATVSSNKEFFEWIGGEESRIESELAVAFSLSHLVLIIENACRIELTLLEQLQNVNRKRMELREKMNEEGLQLNSDNRFAIPRFIFVLHRHLIRKDLGNSKRKEVLEKLEQSLEDQTFSIFKQYKLLSSGGENSCEEALGHIWGEGYIHLMGKTNEVSTQHILSKLFSALDGDVEDENESNMNRLFSFLNSHIRKVREGKKLVNEIPTHDRFVTCATHLLNAVESLSIEDDESEFLNKLTKTHMEKAREKYMPYGTNLVLSRVEHEERMNCVLESIQSIQVNLDSIQVKTLKESFEAIWSSDLRSCEYRSLLGNGCRLAAHASIGDGVDKEKWTLHSSSVTHISACNCGRSQIVRNDPFTLKEANCDFYAQFSCCERAMETHQFKLVADERGRRMEVLEEEWPEARIVGQIGERTNEEKRDEEGEGREEATDEEAEGEGEGGEED
ncbi:hypothetical protein PENTCL1PPCAC_6566, partial [Pristionchus entomophagus]